MGKQLRDMLTDLRAELGHSTNVAHGINDRDTLIYYLDRTQQDLYRDYDWPQLIVDRDTDMVQGQRYYQYPADLTFEDVSKLWLISDSNMWISNVTYGIGPREMRLYDSEAGDQSWPPRRWQHNADSGMFEVWPIPDATTTDHAGRLRMRGTKTVTKLVNDSDQATLPDHLIVLFCAAEILARDEAKDAQLKMTKANEVMRRHRVRQFSHKREPFVMGGGGGDARAPMGEFDTGVVGLDYIPPGYGSG
jgi:hypothetical protein